MPKMNQILRGVFKKNDGLTNGSDPIGPIRPTGWGSKTQGTLSNVGRPTNSKKILYRTHIERYYKKFSLIYNIQIHSCKKTNSIINLPVNTFSPEYDGNEPTLPP